LGILFLTAVYLHLGSKVGREFIRNKEIITSTTEYCQSFNISDILKRELLRLTGEECKELKELPTDF